MKKINKTKSVCLKISTTLIKLTIKKRRHTLQVLEKIERTLTQTPRIRVWYKPHDRKT